MDVYNFLHIVRGQTDGEEETNACLDLEMFTPHNFNFEVVFEGNHEMIQHVVTCETILALSTCESMSTPHIVRLYLMEKWCLAQLS